MRGGRPGPDGDCDVGRGLHGTKPYYRMLNGGELEKRGGGVQP